MPEGELPSVFRAADIGSLAAQRRVLGSEGLRLTLVVAAAVFAALSLEVGGRFDAAAAVVALAFAAALVVELWQVSDRAGDDWYDGRALAESVKSVAWRYAVRAQPYAGLDEEARLRLTRDVRFLLDEFPGTPPPGGPSPLITAGMHRLRSSEFTLRRSTYLAERIEDQRNWYAERSAANRTSARRWRVFLVVAELAGIGVALARTVGALSFDAPGIIAAVVGAASAWLALKQHESNARAYTVAAGDLLLVAEELAITEEAEWATRVADAEEAISREHRTWRAGRRASGP